MNPEEKAQFEDLKKQVEELKNQLATVGTDQNQSKNFYGYKPVDDTTIDRDIIVTIGLGSDTIQVLDYPDEMVEFRYGGKLGRIPWYDPTRFNT